MSFAASSARRRKSSSFSNTVVFELINPSTTPLWAGTQRGGRKSPARALALQRSLLLLDEPSAGLSRNERDDLARFLLRIKRQLKLAMIWVEHDMQMVADVADRIHGARLRAHAAGRPEQVLADPAVIAAYLGAPG